MEPEVIVVSQNSGITPAVVAGLFALLVAVASGVLSFRASRKNLRIELDGRIQEIRERAIQDVRTAERQYQLEAMKAFREAVGPAKSQIIDAIHGLSDRLRGFLSGKHPSEWTQARGYYRKTFTWLLVQPIVWMAILRHELVYLDQTLGEMVEDELRFLGYCRLLQDTLTDTALFNGMGYDNRVASAHVFRGVLESVTEELIVRDGSRERCVASAPYTGQRSSGFKQLVDIEELVTDLHKESATSDFRVARLVAVYVGANTFLDRFSLPFRHWESAEASLARVDAIRGSSKDLFKANLEAFLRRRLVGLTG